MTIERRQGALIARYEGQRVLGAGGMATVYRTKYLIVLNWFTELAKLTAKGAR
jgi:hypothetical protein